MEHDEKPLPIDIRLLGALAEKVLIFSFFIHACLCSLDAAPLNNFLTVILDYFFDFA